jgi:hypothetical protein
MSPFPDAGSRIRRGTRAALAERKGRDSNPGDRSRGLTVFKTAAFNRSATLPSAFACYDVAPTARLRPRRRRASQLDLAFPGSPWRGGREAEGTRLLSEYGDQTPSRVRIPPSPLRPRSWRFAPSQGRCATALLSKRSYELSRLRGRSPPGQATKHRHLPPSQVPVRYVRQRSALLQPAGEARARPAFAGARWRAAQPLATVDD